MSDQQVFTDKEASIYLRVSRITLWRERKSGRVTFRRLRGKIIYTLADLENYLERNKRG
jgi:predicted DNA-binding protein (UPF0251 family)